MSRVIKEKVNLGNINVDISDVNYAVFCNNSGETLEVQLNGVKIINENGVISVADNNHNKIMCSTVIRKIKNTVVGLTKRYEINLEVNGIGYKADLLSENMLILFVGLSHNVMVLIPDDIFTKVVDNKILLSSINFEKLTSFASYVKKIKKVEPYKGKGIIQTNDFIRRKEVKVNKK